MTGTVRPARAGYIKKAIALSPGDGVGCALCIAERVHDTYQPGFAWLGDAACGPADGNANYLCNAHVDEDALFCDTEGRVIEPQWTIPAYVARQIAVPVERWPGQCFGIASLLVNKGVVEGKAVYGAWNGPVAEGTLFHGRGIVRHGWVQLPDGEIVDPTRWVFEGAAPYVYVGPNDHYDEAAQAVSEMLFMDRPLPELTPETVPLTWPDVETRRFVQEHIGSTDENCSEEELTLLYSHASCFYLGNTPVSILGDFAGAVIGALVRAGRGVVVPMDVRRMVLGV